MITMSSAETPVLPLATTAEAVAHMRLVTSDAGELAYIQALIDAATEFIESAANASLSVRERVFEINAQGCCGDYMRATSRSPLRERLPYMPFYTGALDVDAPAMVAVDDDGVETAETVNAEQLRRGYVDLPAVGRYILTATMGPVTINPMAKQACLLLVGHWYEHREAVDDGRALSEVPMTVNTLVKQLWRPMS